MAENSKIAWCDHTFNPWIGCTKVSPGCEHCYAAQQDKLRKWTPEGWGKGKPRKRTKTWGEPLKWNNSAICDACGEISSIAAVTGNMGKCPKCHQEKMRNARVFCASLADWLDDEVPIEWLADLLKLIHDTPNLDWLLLTKRAENWRRRIEEAVTLWEDAPECAEEMSEFLDGWLDCIDMPERGCLPQNVWIGTTVENQEYADKRIPELLKIPAQVRFLSCEPLLGGMYLKAFQPFFRADEDFPLKYCGLLAPEIHWVICGGESGSGHRSMEIEWAQSLADQCSAAGVAFLMKQDSGPRSGMQGRLPEALWGRKEFPGAHAEPRSRGELAISA